MTKKSEDEYERVWRNGGQTYEPDTSVIGYHGVRLGGIVGEHDFNFSSENETITISHEAHDKSIKVYGVLEAANWLHRAATRAFHDPEFKKLYRPKAYGMIHLLGAHPDEPHDSTSPDYLH